MEQSCRKRGFIFRSSVFMMTSALLAPVLIQIKPFVYDGCNGVHSHAHKTLSRLSVWHETYRRARSDQSDTKRRSEALRPVRSIARIKTFARDGYLCRIALIEPDVGSTLVSHERKRERHLPVIAALQLKPRQVSRLQLKTRAAW